MHWIITAHATAVGRHMLTISSAPAGGLSSAAAFELGRRVRLGDWFSPSDMPVGGWTEHAAAGRRKPKERGQPGTWSAVAVAELFDSRPPPSMFK